MAGTKYNTKQELIDAFKALIFPNKKKEITGAKHQQSGLDIIESLWSDGSGTPDLQAVLDEGSTASITTDFNVQRGFGEYDFAETLSFYYDKAKSTNAWMTLISNPGGFTMEAIAGFVGSETKLGVTPGVIDIQANDFPVEAMIYMDGGGWRLSTDNGSESIVLNAVSSSSVEGITVTPNVSSPEAPSATLDIVGDLRVRGLSDADEDDVLVISSNGTVGKRPDKTIFKNTNVTNAIVNVDIVGTYILTAQAQDFSVSSPSGTPKEGQKILYRLKDDGTGRLISWNAVFRAMGDPLPTTTVANKTVYIEFIYNIDDTKWDAINVTQEA